MKRFNVFLIYLFLLTASCETWDYYTLDKFNFDGTSHTVKVFVEGGITTQNAYHRISLYKPSDYLLGTTTENIISAKVYVTHENDTFFFKPITKYWSEYNEDTLELENPYYQAKERFAAVVDGVFTLHIEYEGEHYFGSDSVVEAVDFDFQDIPLPIVEEANVMMEDAEEQPEYLLSLQWHHFGFPVSNEWIWSGKETFIDTINIFYNYNYATAYSHQFADAQGLFSNIEYYTAMPPEYTEKDDTLVVIRVSLSDGYYKHLNQKFMEYDWKEGVFASQPGNLSTNMSEGAMGYFFASDLYKKEIIVEKLLNLIK